MKARSARPEDPTDLQETEVEDSGHQDVLEQLMRTESLQSMRTLIEETLDETEKRVMVMRYSEEISLEAITRVLGLTNASGARAYVVSARRKLDSAVQRWKARQQRGGK